MFEAGSNSFVLSPSKWIESTNAIGIISKVGSGGGTYAHIDIALEFASWVSAEFKLYLLIEFKRLKSIENEIQMSLEGDGVIKEGWKLEIIEGEKLNNSTIQKWVERRIFEEKKARENSIDKGEFIANGGKLKAFSDVLEYIKTHPIK